MSGRVELDGALAVVTGAGSGIGDATARRFAKAGARVVGVDIAADAVAEVCERSYVCDVADADAVVALAARVAAEHGDVDILARTTL